MNFTVIGLFKDAQKAKEVSTYLTNEGFLSNNIDVSPYQGDTTMSDENIGHSYEEDEETSGFWNWLFGDDEDTRTQYSAVASRSTIVTFRTDSRAEAEKAVSVMDEMGAIDVNEEYGQLHSSTGVTDTKNIHSQAADSVLGDEVIPVVKEELAVGKREVETGGISVRSTIIEKPVEEHIRLRHERAYVTRKPVDRVVDATDAFQDKTIEVTERNEEAVVEKTARVVEEITVGKEVDQYEETISDTVRETNVEVDERAGGDIAQGFKVSNYDNNGNVSGSNRKTSGFNENRIDRSFSNVGEANQYYDFLLDQGYSKDEITVLMSKDTKEKFYAMNDHIDHTGDSALKGAGTGGAIGGTVGALAGAIATVGGAILVPGLGLAIAGPIAAAFAGAGVGGATGAVVGALTNAGLSDSTATEYNNALEKGEVIISVDPKNNEDSDLIGTYQYGHDLYNGYRTV